MVPPYSVVKNTAFDLSLMVLIMLFKNHQICHMKDLELILPPILKITEFGISFLDSVGGTWSSLRICLACPFFCLLYPWIHCTACYVIIYTRG